MIEETKNWQAFTVILTSILMLVSVIWSFNGQWPGYTAEYNTYSIQAAAWLNGVYDVHHYKHLELVVFNEQVYVSFPPFPSVVMLPFVVLFGENTPNALINLFFIILGVFYAYRLARNFNISCNASLFLAFFISLSSNLVFLMQNGWVWFFAQTLSFTFTMMAFYYATTKNDKDFIIAFLLLSFAIGCRPFQIFYGFVLLFLMYQRIKEVKILIFYMLPGILVGISYGVYNYIRFKDFFEFGHNYLPHLINNPSGQFHISYLIPHLKSLFLIPPINENKIVEYPEFGGFSVFLLNPIIVVIIILFIIYLVSLYINREKKEEKNRLPLMSLIIGAIAMHIIATCMHDTMGVWQFGNRYLIDILPAAFLLMCLLDSKIDKIRIMYIPFFIVGFTLNVIGTTLFYLQ